MVEYLSITNYKKKKRKHLTLDEREQKQVSNFNIKFKLNVKNNYKKNYKSMTSTILIFNY